MFIRSSDEGRLEPVGGLNCQHLFHFQAECSRKLPVPLKLDRKSRRFHEANEDAPILARATVSVSRPPVGAVER